MKFHIECIEYNVRIMLRSLRYSIRRMAKSKDFRRFSCSARLSLIYTNKYRNKHRVINCVYGSSLSYRAETITWIRKLCRRHESLKCHQRLTFFTFANTFDTLVNMTDIKPSVHTITHRQKRLIQNDITIDVNR